MGSLKHPSAELARKAFADRDYAGALQIVDHGLEISPGEPDLACEAAILAVYRAQEDQAFELLPICSAGERFDLLTSLLADHYTSRILADRTDHDARKRLQLVRTFHPKESRHVGVKVCACIIVKNEEKSLPRCLNSLIGKVDQIVVVDTGSTDSTVELAKKHGARVVEFAWTDDFAAARNYGLSFATANWILSIDADEEITADSKAALDRAVIRPQFGGFDIDIVNYLDGANERAQFCHCPTRLFRNLPGVKYTGRIHEQINPSLVKLGLPWARLDGATLLHYGYQPEMMQEKGKIDRTISLLRREVDDDSTNAFQWFNLANAYLVAKRYAEAKNAAKSAIKGLNSSNGFAMPAFCILIQSLHVLGEFDEAIYYADEAISRGLDGIQIAFEKCGALLSSGRYEEALIQSEHMMVFDWPKGATGDMGIYTYKKFVLRARALSHFQRFEEALACLDVALYASPDYGPALFSKAQILEQTGDSESALQLYRKASLDPACAAAASAAAANLLKGSGRYQEAAELWHQIWVNDREALSAWLQWKQVCELAENPILLLQCFEQLAATRQLDAELMVDWGRAWAAAGRSADAIRCFAEAMKLEPGYANAYFNCGDVMLQAGMADRSVEMYRAGLSLTPEHAAGWFVLGNALAHCGREQASIEAYERALEIEPGHPGALYNLGSLRAA